MIIDDKTHKRLLEGSLTKYAGLWERLAKGEEMNIEVEIERPVTIKANGKKIRLSHAEALELADKLCRALGHYPSQYTYTYPNMTGWYDITGATYTTSGGDIEITI